MIFRPALPGCPFYIIIVSADFPVGIPVLPGMAAARGRRGVAGRFFRSSSGAHASDEESAFRWFAGSGDAAAFRCLRGRDRSRAGEIADRRAGRPRRREVKCPERMYFVAPSVRRTGFAACRYASFPLGGGPGWAGSASDAEDGGDSLRRSISAYCNSNLNDAAT